MRVVAVAGLLLLASAVAGSRSVGTPLPERLQEHHGALYRGQIYLASGIDSTNEPTKVAYRLDLRRKRDHLEAQVVNNVLYAIGGRPISPGGNYDVAEAYEFAHDRWS